MDKYCKDCKFYVKVGSTFLNDPIYSVCSKSKEKARPDLVTGVKRMYFADSDRCRVHRSQTDSKLDFCGVEALWFEPKTS